MAEKTEGVEDLDSFKSKKKTSCVVMVWGNRAEIVGEGKRTQSNGLTMY